MSQFTINPITPTCARCLAAFEQAVAKVKPLCPRCWHTWTNHDAGGCHARRSCGPSGVFRCNCRDTVPGALQRAVLMAPPRLLRKVVDRFEDWRGEQEELECGHIVLTGKFLRHSRRCDACLDTGTGGEVVALHDIRCGCYRCTNRSPNP